MGTGRADGSARDEAAVKRRRVRLLQRYVINPPLKLLARWGRYPGHVLLETVGRRTGRRRLTVVGARWEGRVLRVVSEHGRHAGYVANLLAQPRVRVWADGRRYRGSASLEERVDPEQLLESWHDPAHARAVRAFGTDLAVVRVDVDPGETDIHR
jgi:deazaflavin-dependent oxidoreductase (nitroreductase family)